MMDAHKASRRQNTADPLMKNTRGDSAQADNSLIVTDHEIPETWLKPSASLTRFIPNETLETGNVRSMAPPRFGVRVGDIGLLVPEGMHSEVVEEARLYPLPTAPLWFRGLINLRGTLVPVFNLSVLFQMVEPDPKVTNLLVLNTDEQALGFLIDGLPVTLDITQRLEHPSLLPPILRDHTQRVYLQDGGIWVEIDFDGFFRSASSQNLV
jgi:twitching motility protein PilI